MPVISEYGGGGIAMVKYLWGQQKTLPEQGFLI
jgi:hypothetical protein